MLYLIGDKPNNLIVDWVDPDNPQVLLELGLGEGITSRWGEQFENIIEEVGASKMSDFGKVMPLVMQRGAGKVDGNLAQSIVKDLLS